MKAKTKVQDNAELQPKNKHHDYLWGLISTIVTAYASKNNLGWLTVWGMLADKADEGSGALYDEMLINHLSFYAAAKKLDITCELIELSEDMFIRRANDA